MLLLLTAFGFNRFLAWHEYRDGIYFNDPVFTLFKGIDCSVVTFVLLYAAILSFLILHFKRIDKLTILAFSYTLVLWLRLICLYLIPFYVDADHVKLEDPFLNTFIYPGNYVARDLFFSGHVAILVLLCLIADHPKWRVFYFLITVVVSCTLILQKVHFSIDVIAAPFFSWLSYAIVQKYFKEIKAGNENS